MNYVELKQQIIEIIKQAKDIILNANRETISITNKQGDANFVTDYDMKVELFLKERLLKLVPTASFLGEETSNDVTSNQVFIVDPIDGTTNFIKDFHHSCISIAYLEGNEVKVAVVCNPYLNEVFHAVKKDGAYLNDKSIRVSNNNLDQAVFLFGSSPYNKELSKKSFDLAYKYFCNCLDVRRSGSAALDLCYVACGRVEIFFELILQPWDFAAGSLIVLEAGGFISDIDGNAINYIKQTSMLAQNKKHKLK